MEGKRRCEIKSGGRSPLENQRLGWDAPVCVAEQGCAAASLPHGGLYLLPALICRKEEALLRRMLLQFLGEIQHCPSLLIVHMKHLPFPSKNIKDAVPDLDYPVFGLTKKIHS